MDNGNGNGRALGLLAQAYLGRSQGPEFFNSFAHNGTAQEVNVAKPLSLNRPLESIIIRWRGRVVIGVANYAAIASEAPQTILQRVRLFGTYKGTALTPIDLTGATIFAKFRTYGLRTSSLYIDNAGAGAVRQADPGVPFQQVGATFGNTGTYDLDIWYVLPVYPIVTKGRRAFDVTPFLWQPADWADTLQIRLQLGDLTSFGTPGAMGTTTFTAYGSGAGTPTVEIYTSYQILGGPFRAGFRTAVLVQNEQSITQGMTSAGTNVRVMPLQKQKTANILVKTGRRLAGTSAGVDVFSDLRDTLLDRTLVVVDNKYIRNVLTNLSVKEYDGIQQNTILPEGYLNFNFIESQSARTALRADLPTVVGSGSQFELVTDVLETNAQSLVNVVQEMIYADADDPYWGGTR